MATTATFAQGVLSAFGDSHSNSTTVSRDVAGNLLVNGGAVPVFPFLGTQPTVANTQLIQVFGNDGNDTISLDETNGALPDAELFGGNGNDTLTGGSGNDTAVRRCRQRYPERQGRQRSAVRRRRQRHADRRRRQRPDVR